jgi:hypothetical protein
MQGMQQGAGDVQGRLTASTVSHPVSKWAQIPGVKFIGVGHKARHGKDSAVAAIHSVFPRETMRFAFGDPLKCVARVMYGMTEKDGRLLQAMGPQFRAQDPDVWVDAIYWHIDEVRPAVALISDVRYPNEAAFVKAMGGTMVKVERRNEDGSLFIDRERNAQHESEILLDDYQYDHVIVNDGGLGDLALKATELFYAIR